MAPARWLWSFCKSSATHSSGDRPHRRMGQPWRTQRRRNSNSSHLLRGLAVGNPRPHRRSPRSLSSPGNRPRPLLEFRLSSTAAGNTLCASHRNPPRKPEAGASRQPINRSPRLGIRKRFPGNGPGHLPQRLRSGQPPPVLETRRASARRTCRTCLAPRPGQRTGA